MPTGYIPARKKPVKKRNRSKLKKLLYWLIIKALQIAPSKALVKKTFEGENRSAIVRRANTKVPEIKPNCTAEVRCPKALASRLKFITKSPITPLPANHNDVQQNWEMTIIGRIRFGGFMF